MLILAFETSAKAASVALWGEDKLLGESYQNTGLTHSQTLMVMAQDLLNQCGKTVTDVTAVAVAEGPGSFTGVRIGMAAAKGFAWGGNIPCYGVSTLEAMAAVELPDPAEVYDKYPHQLSGGMCQRAMIAAAIVARPKLLLLDEPTTALDVTIQAQILELLKKLNRETGMSMLFISHNLAVVRKLCARVAVMQRGVLVEEGDTDQVFLHPREDYTKRLIAAIPTRNRKEGPQ